MSAPGAGGGRSFPVYIDLITRGAARAASEIKSVESSLQNIGGHADNAAKGLNNTASSGRVAAQSLQNTGSAAKLTSQGLAAGVDNANAFSAGLKQVKGSGDAVTASLEQGAAATAKMHRGTSQLRTGLQAFRNAGRGAQFAIIGLVGSVNEAVFMIQSLAEANQKVGAAQAEVDRLTREGAQGTREYTQAVNDLEEAERGRNFTARITAQSILDNVTFSGMLLSQLPKVIAEYRKLRTEAAQAGSVLGQQGGILQRLSSIFGGFGRSTQTVAQSAAAATQTIADMGTSAGTAGNALSTVGTRAAASAGQMRLFPEAVSATEAAFRGVVSSAGNAGGALVGVGGAAKNSALQATSAVLGFEGLAIAQDRAGQAAAAAAGPTANSGRIAILSGAQAGTGAVGWGALTAAMRTAGQAAWAFVSNPLGALLIGFAALVTILVALEQNWFGITDSLYAAGAAMEEQAGGASILAQGLNEAGHGLGIVTSEEKKTIETTRKLAEEAKSLTDEIIVLGDSVLNFGTGWEDVGNRTKDILSGIQQDTFAFASAFGDSLVSQIDFVHERFNALADDDPLKGFYAAQLFYLESIQQHVNVAMTEVESSLADTTGAVGNFGTAWEKTWNDVLTQAGSAPQVISALPQAVGDAVREMAEIVDKAFDTGALDIGEQEQVIRGILTRTWVEPMRELGPEFEAAFAQFQQHAKNIMNNAELLPEQKVEALRNLNAAFLQTIGPLTQVASASDQAAAAAEAHAAIEERRADVMKRVAEGITGLSEAASLNLSINKQILDSTNLQTQAFNENAVMLDASAKGLLEWHNVQAQAYHTIVQNAQALGFFGDMSKQNVVAMLDHIAATERQNEANQTAVEGFFSLGAEQRKTIDSSGALAERMGQVALATQDVSVADAAVIAEQVRLNEANQDAIETYLGLSDAQRASLAQLGITPDIMQQVIDGTITMSDAMRMAIESQGELTEAVDEHKKTIEGLMPSLQQYAATLGLVNTTASEITPVQEAMTQSLVDAQAAYDDSIQSAVDFIAEQGKLGDIVGMSNQQMLIYLATMEDIGPTMEQQAEMTKQAAKDLADTWEQEMDRVAQAWETSSDAFATAAENISEDIGDAGAEGAAAFTEGFLTEFVPQQVVEEAFDENFDVEDLIDDIRDEAEDAMEDGLISDVAMRDAIEPMLKEMEAIPGETEFQMGQMIAIARRTMTDLKPVISGGIHEVGRDAMSAIESGLLQPMEQALATGAGTQVWQPLVDNFKQVVNNLPPEYDRMKGDWLQMLSDAGTDTRSQVNVIMGILKEIAPEWHAQVMAMDTDGDGIANMFDTVDDSAVAMRDAIVDAAIISALAVKDFATAARLDYIRDNFEKTGYAADGAATEIWDVADATAEAGKQAGLASTPTGEYMDWFGQQTPAMQADAKELYNVATAISGTGTAADTATPQIEAVPRSFDGWGNINSTVSGAIGGVEESLNGVPETAKTAGTDSVNNFSSGWTLTNFTTLLDPVNTALSDTSKAEQAGKDQGAAFMRAWVSAAVPAKDVRTGERTGTGSATAGVGVGGTTEGRPPEEAAPAPAAPAGLDTTFIDTYKQKLTELNTLVSTTVPAMELKWTNHFTNTSAQLNTFVSGSLSLLTQAYTLMQTMVVPTIAAMELAWTMHMANNTAQIVAFIAGPLTLLSQAYLLYQTNVVPIIAAMELAWTSHLANTGGQMVAFIAGPLTLLGQAYTLFQTNVPSIIATMELAWTNHLANNGAQISAFISGPIAGYINAMPLVAQSVHGNLENANQNWAAHGNHVGNVAAQISDHLAQLESDVRSTMNGIADAMGVAEQAARDLKASIDALQDKTITVTTNYVTNGVKATAEGFNGTVRGPQLFLAGEAGPEHVKITPVHASTTSSDGIMRAEKGVDTIVRPLENSDIAEFVGSRGHRVREIKQDDDDGKTVVRVEKVYKTVPKMTKKEWKDWSETIGWRVHDFDKKGYGFEVDLKPKKGARVLPEDADVPEGFAGGAGGDEPGAGFRGGGFGDVGGDEAGAARAEAAAGTFQRPGATTATGGGMGGGGGGTTGGTGGITKINFAGPVTVHTSVNLTVEMDHIKFGKLVREVTSEGNAVTK